MNHKALANWTGGTLLTLLAGVAWGFPTTPCTVASATCRTVSINSGLVGAQAIFQWDDQAGTDQDFLYITLSNISTKSTTYSINDVLTGLFFTLKDTGGNYVALTEKYADISWNNINIAGTPDIVAATPETDIVRSSDGENLVNNVDEGGDSDAGSEWAYRAATGVSDKLYKGFRAGISSTSMGSLFSGPNFCGTISPGNSNEGDTSSACNDSDATFAPIDHGLVGSNFTGLTGGTETQPFVQDSVLLKLAVNGNATLNLSQAGALNVGFQFGDLGRHWAVPEPSTVALLGLGVALLGWRRHRRMMPAA